MSNSLSTQNPKHRLMEDSLRELEFPQVLQLIAQSALSDLGKELILNARPIDDIAWLTLEHDRIGELRDLLVKGEVLPTEGISDIRNAVRKSMIAGSFLNASELLDVFEAMRACRLLASYFKNKAESYPILAQFADGFYENRFLEKHITDAIDDTGAIRDTASKELAHIRREIVETSSRLRSRLNKLLAKVSAEDLVTEEFITQREGRFVLPMRASEKRTLPGIIHGISNTGATVFVEPSEIVEMNNQLSLLLGEERREMIRILTMLTAEIASEAALILGSTDVLGHFDALFAKARYALDMNGMKPVISHESSIELRHVYHPLLYARQGKKPIPLSIEFGSGILGHLISGPNAGGKTVALKSIGLNIAMALSGIFPLGECRTSPKSLFCAIGDHQSIEHNLSTFSSQVMRLKDIVDHADETSLILIDEICSGTDPQEGSALASAILDHCIKNQAMFIVTTHQSSLKSYALNRKELLNASMEFDPVHLVPTYTFLSGIPGNSYAFALANSIGMSTNVMNQAREYLGDKHSELEESIASLQAFRIQAEESLKSARIELSKAQTLREEYEVKASDIKKKKAEYLHTAREEAKEILSSANGLIEQTIKEIREQQKDVSDIRKQYDAVKQELTKKIHHEEQKDSSQSNRFSIGDSVIIGDNIRDVGIIITLDESTGSGIVEFNGIKFKTQLSQLRLAKGSEKRKAQKSMSTVLKLDAKTSIDLRGFRADEACKDVERLLSDAILANISLVTIIHGKGTGALRKAIHEQLTGHPGVKTFRNGTIPEGGDGVTVVEMQ
ncbi:MAG: endonuclease MutS2 [Candidatus Kapaibacteriota bacterium]